MNSQMRRILCAAAAVFGLSLLTGAKPAAADPPDHAKAWGWRKKHAASDLDYRHERSDRYDRNRRHGDDDRYHRDGYQNRYDRSYNGRYRHYGNDIDGDGIPNNRDRDIDGDGIPNWRDNKPYGSGFDYSGSSRYGARRRK